MSAYKTYFNWSTGKDSALALYHLLQNKSYRVKHLVTAVNAFHNRVTMHGVRRELLVKQFESIGIPFSTVELPEMPSNVVYEKKMDESINRLKLDGFECAGFGDIFLEDLKAYRETQLKKHGIAAIFPLWKRDTRELIDEFLSLGFKAIVVCVNAKLLDRSFAGRMIDHSFVKELPDNVDPCGENGEFHTFCFDGPVFKTAIDFNLGEVVYKEYNSASGFWFCDLLPGK
ncbi:hypothetical protein WSM22_24370 [Cytophagales bacterium WSM2-2]|nr:hypothetical protein WSM22_24370 [Cytophagales bacterium WSM2-2]